MATTRGFVLGLGSAATVAMIAGCSGTSPGSDFDTPSLGPIGDGANNGFGSTGPSLGVDGGIAGDPARPSDGTVCATRKGAAEALPVYLVFMFDRSGSMKFNPSPNSKWDSSIAGLNAFFVDPRSSGMSASLQVFPHKSNECSSATYQTPIVDVTPLPDTSGALKKALASNGPEKDFGTPTLPALKGALAHAQSVQSKLTHGERVAVVLVTDGDPNDCSSTAQNVAAAAAAVAKAIPTYVIGVGSEVSKLDTIAQGGGTKKAIIVKANDPEQIAQDFQKAVGQIKAQTLSCEYKLPDAPAGKTLDVNTVNVQFTPKSGAPQTLTYNKDCGQSGEGWRYDDGARPTKIEICRSSCDTLRTDTAAKLDIVVGCHTQGVGPGGVTK